MDFSSLSAINQWRHSVYCVGNRIDMYIDKLKCYEIQLILLTMYHLRKAFELKPGIDIDYDSELDVTLEEIQWNSMKNWITLCI